MATVIPADKGVADFIPQGINFGLQLQRAQSSARADAITAEMAKRRFELFESESMLRKKLTEEQLAQTALERTEFVEQRDERLRQQQLTNDNLQQGINTGKAEEGRATAQGNLAQAGADQTAKATAGMLGGEQVQKNTQALFDETMQGLKDAGALAKAQASHFTGMYLESVAAIKRDNQESLQKRVDLAGSEFFLTKPGSQERENFINSYVGLDDQLVKVLRGMEGIGLTESLPTALEAAQRLVTSGAIQGEAGAVLKTHTAAAALLQYASSGKGDLKEIMGLLDSKDRVEEFMQGEGQELNLDLGDMNRITLGPKILTDVQWLAQASDRIARGEAFESILQERFKSLSTPQDPRGLLKPGSRIGPEQFRSVPQDFQQEVRSALGETGSGLAGAALGAVVKRSGATKARQVMAAGNRLVDVTKTRKDLPDDVKLLYLQFIEHEAERRAATFRSQARREAARKASRNESLKGPIKAVQGQTGKVLKKAGAVGRSAVADPLRRDAQKVEQDFKAIGQRGKQFFGPSNKRAGRKPRLR